MFNSRVEPPSAGEPPQKRIRVSSDGFGAQQQPHPAVRIESPIPIPPRRLSYVPRKPSTPAATNHISDANHRLQQPQPIQSQSPVPVPNFGNHSGLALPPAFSKPFIPFQAWQSPVLVAQFPKPSPPVQYSQSPVPIPQYAGPTNHFQAAPSEPRITPIESAATAAAPALPSFNNNNALRGTYLPSPLSEEQPKFSNSPIPLPTIPQNSLTPYGAEQSQASQLTTSRSSDSSLQEARRADQPRTTSTNNANGDAPTAPSRKKSRSQFDPTSPQNFRTRAQARALREDGTAGGPGQERPTWASLASKPYESAATQREIKLGTRKLVKLGEHDLTRPLVFHVDFSPSEIEEMIKLFRRYMRLGKGPSRTKNKKTPRKELMDLLRDYADQVFQILSRFPATLDTLPGRTVDDVKAFLSDLKSDLGKKRYKPTHDPEILTLERDELDTQGALLRSSRVNSLLYAREVGGQRGYGSMRRLENYTNKFRICRQDDLELRAEWTEGAGDITTITWLSNDVFICGTTEHSDAHNQQYNKPNNLILGSLTRAARIGARRVVDPPASEGGSVKAPAGASLVKAPVGRLQAYPDHRVARPVVETGENSTEEMRQSQSPWLFTSVVSSDYDERHDRAYTCGFDRTVKVWKAEKSGASMSVLGTWHHAGNVNFVVASKHKSGMVATAADVPSEAVRIYHVDDKNVPGSPYRAYSCSRVVDSMGNAVSIEKWAYYPAAIQFARCPGYEHLVAVGYSPRSRTGDDNDIPEDRRDTGEICVWDGLTGERWHLIAGSRLNVFEILWHPTQLSFIVATAPQGKHGIEYDAKVRSQIRIYVPAPEAEFGKNAFSVLQTLDCRAMDINELTIMPNSARYSYVTAGCTDGNTYVWDTALGDKPIHVLKHGTPIDEYRGDREKEDTGVKFCAWGTTPDRFYTGSSDGVVKVWNVRTKGKPRPRDLLEAPGPISFGKFSPDMSKLIIGDATGRVFFLSIDEVEQILLVEEKTTPLGNLPPLGLLHQNGKREARRPQPITRHKEDPTEPEGISLARAYLANRQLVLSPDPLIRRLVGAVKGPNYAETGLFCADMHANDDAKQPLLARVEGDQQYANPPRRNYLNRKEFKMRPLRRNDRLAELHERNIWLPFHSLHLSEETKAAILNDGQGGPLMELDIEEEFTPREGSEDFRGDGLDEESPEPQADDEAMVDYKDYKEDGKGEEIVIDLVDDDDHDDIMELSEQEWLSSRATLNVG